MIGAIAWRVALAIVAVIAIGVQLDRQTERSPELALGIPEIFRSSAQPRIVGEALRGDDPLRALAEAQSLVRRRPVPAEHLRLLSRAQFAAGRPDEAALTIQYAAQRGWRDPLAQQAMLALALAAGDEAEAARRYTALFLRGSADEAQLAAVGRDVLAAPGGLARMTMASILADSVRRQGQFLQKGAQVLPPDAFVEIVETMAERGAVFDCDALGRARDRIARREAGAGEDLARFLRSQC